MESGYYVASHNSKGLPVEVGECPLIVFKISAQSAVQFIAYKNELYVRIYWTGSFLGWRKFFTAINIVYILTKGGVVLVDGYIYPSKLDGAFRITSYLRT